VSERNETVVLRLDLNAAEPAEASKSGVPSLGVNYRPPESLPLHQRDFRPRGASEDRAVSRRNEGSHQLALMVTLYLVAMFGGIVLLGNLTASTTASITTAQILAGRQVADGHVGQLNRSRRLPDTARQRLY